MRKTRTRRARGDRGAVLAEAALTLPLVFMFIFGIIEYGLVFRDDLTVTNGSRDGARAATAFTEPLGDYKVLQTMAESLKVIDEDDIEQILIYRAAHDADPPSAACLALDPVAHNASTGMGCNVYTLADLDFPDRFGCDDASDWDQGWCPGDRDVVGSSFAGDVDYVGVYVKLDHQFVTGFFGNGMTLTENTIMRMEPVRAS